MYYLSITRLKLRSVSFLIPFFLDNEKIVIQIRHSDGFLKGKQLATFDLSMWTTTLWESHKAMKDFYLTGAHKEAMKKIEKWSCEAVHLVQEMDNVELPSWHSAAVLLAQKGVFSELQYSSSNHQKKYINRPQWELLNRTLKY